MPSADMHLLWFSHQFFGQSDKPTHWLNLRALPARFSESVYTITCLRMTRLARPLPRIKCHNKNIFNNNSHRGGSIWVPVFISGSMWGIGHCDSVRVSVGLEPCLHRWAAGSLTQFLPSLNLHCIIYKAEQQLHLPQRDLAKIKPKASAWHGICI